MGSRAFIILAVALARSPGWSQSVNAQTMDGSQVSQVLSEVKSLASFLKSDVATLDFVAFSAGGSQTRASTLDRFAQHAAALRRQSGRLDEIRKYGSSSQQTAIDRMVPVMKEFASSSEAAIKAARTTPVSGGSQDYREYMKLNSDLAQELSDVISAWVDYATTKENLDRVAGKVGVSSGLGPLQAQRLRAQH